jgi:hypothetical protein
MVECRNTVESVNVLRIMEPISRIHPKNLAVSKIILPLTYLKFTFRTFGHVEVNVEPMCNLNIGSQVSA